MTLHEKQESVLHECASAGHGWRDLIYFYLSKRDTASLEALRRRVDSFNERDRVLLAIADMAVDPSIAPPSIEELGEETDPWVYYTIAKAHLAAGKITEAIALALAFARRCPQDSLVLNLVVRQCIATGEPALASRLIDTCLRLNPYQADLPALKERPAVDLYLEIWPKPATVCFYVPVYNVERYIRSAIEGLLSQNHPLAEILVVDDGTPDRSIEIASEYPVRIIRHEENLGLAAARNTAFGAAKTEYVGAIDSDACPDVGYTKYALMEFENGGPRLAGVGGRLKEAYATDPPDKWRAFHVTQDPGVLRLHNPQFLYGSNALFRRQAVLDVGAFEVRHRTNYEDVQMCQNLLSHGYELVHTPWAVAHHLRRDTVRSILKTRWNWIYWNRAKLGIFEDPLLIISQIDYTMAESLGLIQTDMDRGYTDLVYIDFLWCFIDAFLNIEFVIRIRLMRAGDGRHIEDLILDVLKHIDAHFGGALYEKVLRDVEDLLVPAGTPSSQQPEWLPPLQNTLALFQETCILSGERLYSILAAQG